jgi:hypothetical protein
MFWLKNRENKQERRKLSDLVRKGRGSCMEDPKAKNAVRNMVQ